MNPTPPTSTAGGQVDRENITKLNGEACSPWKRDSRVEKRASHFKSTILVSGKSLPLSFGVSGTGILGSIPKRGVWNISR